MFGVTAGKLGDKNRNKGFNCSLRYDFYAKLLFYI